MESDREILDRYLALGEEIAFAELVRRHLPHVFGAALRLTGDRGLAEDVSQEVFCDLARKARSLPDTVVLAAWLHRATRFAARDAIRSGRRRAWREQRASMMETQERVHAEPPWEDVQGWLDEALDALPSADRDALCVRYLEQRSLADVAASLGTTPEAARKRVDRALNRLRDLLDRRGIRTTAEVLGQAMLAHAVPPLPNGLVSSVLGANAGLSTGVSTGVAPAFMASTSLKSASLLIAAALLVGIPLVRQEQAIAHLQSQLQDEGGVAGNLLPIIPGSEAVETATDESARLEMDNASLRRQLRHVEEQMRVRQEAATERGARLLGDRRAIAELVDSGQSSPENAFRSSLAAMRSGNTNRMAEICWWPPDTSPLLLASYLRAADPEHPRGLAADLRSGGIASVVFHRVEPADSGDSWLVYHLELANGTAGPVFQIRMRSEENRWHMVLNRTAEPDQSPVSP